MLKYDKDQLKAQLTIDDMASLLAHLGGDPMVKNNQIVARTICHNHFDEGSHKLYYYDNTHLFRCYTDCGDSFDIFELIIKAKEIQENANWELPHAMHFVAQFFGISPMDDTEADMVEDWKILHKYEQLENIDLNPKEVQLKTYPRDMLRNFPRPRIIPWEKEGIKKQVMDKHEIAYNPITGGILMPHFDYKNQLVGIRERTLVKENEERGKYLPSIINKIQYSHPLGFNLYGLENSKDNIEIMKTALIVEAEKSVMLYESYFGIENSLAVATCGSNLTAFQFQLLRELGVCEIIIAFDKDFEEVGDDNFNRLVKKLRNLNDKYGCYVKVSFIFDKEDLLGYKDSPLDKGKDVFLHLYQNRIIL